MREGAALWEKENQVQVNETVKTALLREAYPRPAAAHLLQELPAGAGFLLGQSGVSWMTRLNMLKDICSDSNQQHHGGKIC